MKSVFRTIKSILLEKKTIEKGIDPSIAKAMILLEVAEFDEEFTKEERACICQILKSDFDLTDQEVTILISEASANRKQHPDIFYSTRKLNEILSVEEKEEFMVQIWKVVLADGKIDYSEDVLTRKLINLLRLDRTVWLKTKKIAEKQCGENNDIDK